MAVTAKPHTRAEHGHASEAYPELPCCFLQAPHLVEGQATAAAQDTAGWVDGAGQLKVPQSLSKLLLLHHDLAQAVPAGTHTGTRGHGKTGRNIVCHVGRQQPIHCLHVLAARALYSLCWAIYRRSTTTSPNCGMQRS